MATDHYAMLGVREDASASDLRAAYLKMARTYHPDTFDDGERAQAEAKMQSINEAWNVLGTPHRRAEYDRSRPAGSPHTGHSRTAGPQRGRTHFEAFDDEPIRPDIDLDPTPIAGSKRLPQWMSLMPAALIVSGMLTFGFGLLVNSAGVLSLGVMFLVLGGVGFLALPLWVMSRAERDPSL